MTEQISKLRVNVIADKPKMIVEAIDRQRRELVQRRNAARGEISEMYYEGAVQALASVQAFAEQVQKL